jgi:hypothetical protein
MHDDVMFSFNCVTLQLTAVRSYTKMTIRLCWYLPEDGKSQPKHVEG